MDADPQLLAVAFTCVVGSVLVLLVAFIARRMLSAQSSNEVADGADDEQSAQAQQHANGVAHNVKKKTTKNVLRSRAADSRAEFSHAWLAGNLKGHSHSVVDIDFASNGKFLVSASDDSSLILWSCKDLTEREHKMSRGQVEMDQAGKIQFGPDSKSMLIHMARANTLGVYKINKKEGASTYKFEPVDSVSFPASHARDIEHIGFACNGHFVMSASSDNNVVLYDIRGTVIHQLDTKQSTVHCALVSPCGRFVATGGFTPDVKVWEVSFDRSANFTGVKRAFELKGHNSGVYSIAFSQDSSRMLSASKDGTWRFWDTDIRYAQGEEAVQLCSGEWDVLKTSSYERVRTALAADCSSAVIAVGSTLRIYQLPVDKKVTTAAEIEEISDVFAHHQITSCAFTPDNSLLAVAGDKHIRIFHNIAGVRAQIERLQTQCLRPQGDAHKRRLEEQIASLNKKLNDILS